jgi:hypothetical protein
MARPPQRIAFGSLEKNRKWSDRELRTAVPRDVVGWSMVEGVLDTLFANLGTNSHSKAQWRHRSDDARGRAHGPV